MFQNFDDDTTNADTADADTTASRISALRHKLRDMGLAGFILPREDAFQGEYVPPANERLKWLTGFSGSAGLAIVLTHKKAALFVDGRYVLQAPQQVDTQHIKVVPTAHTHATQWLRDHVKRGQKIGIDSRLHTQTALMRFEQTLQAIGAQLVLVARNPVDALWQHRPALPQTPIEAQPLRLTGQSSLEKRYTLAAYLQLKAIDATPISKPENIAWLLNIRANDVPHMPVALSFGVLHKSGLFDWYIDPRRISPEVKRTMGKNVNLKAPNKLAHGLAALANKTVCFDPDATPAWIAHNLRKSKIIHQPDPCALPKACKTKAEIRGAISAHKYDGIALCQFLCWLDKTAPRKHITEIDAAQKIEALRMATGKLRDLSFDSISGTGAHGAIVHYRVTRATNCRLRNGDIYLLDSGGQYRSGTTDVTRTVLIGTKKPKREVIDAFTRVLRGHLALGMVRFPEGTNGMQLDTLARAPLWEAGLDFAHGTGHGVGSYLSVHEGPQRIAKGGDVVLQAGMIVSNEPGYYKQGQYGIRIENLQYVAKGKDGMLQFEPLTLAPIDRRLIDASMLAPNERDWLNDYHAYVYDTLAAKLDGATRKWLKRACAII